MTKVGNHAYYWDDADRLTKFDAYGGTVNDATYAYLPGSWKRYKRVENTTAEYYVLDGDNVLDSYASGGSLNARYLTPGLDVNLSMTRDGNSYYYMTDGPPRRVNLGSIRNVVDASETVENVYDYYAFGNTLGTPTAGVTSPYEYTAREFENGSVNTTFYYRNRYYMSALGVFMGRDAMWAHRHRGWGYVRNVPIHDSDPSGYLSACCEGYFGVLTHCELKNKCGPKDTRGDFPVWPDDSPDRSSDNGTPCDKMTIGDIESCLFRNNYSAGSGTYGDNCQTNTACRIAKCCLKSSWKPSWYSGNNDCKGNCIAWEHVNWDAGNGELGCYSRCVKWQYPWKDGNVPEGLDPESGPQIVALDNYKTYQRR